MFTLDDTDSDTDTDTDKMVLQPICISLLASANRFANYFCRSALSVSVNTP